MSTNLDKLLFLDVETSGFTPGEDITRNHQIVSIGLVVATGEFEPVASLYREIKPNGTSHWNPQAEKVHGLTREYLESNGVSEEEAVADILEFLMKYWNIVDEAIVFGGHNVRPFDIPFFRKLMSKYDVEVKIAFRTIDTFAAGFVALAAQDSEELFNMFGTKRKGKHNALQDATLSLGVCRKIRKLMDAAING